MSRTKALNITLSGGSEKEQLAEIYGAVIENIGKSAVSTALKNKDLSGDPAAGSVEVKRFTNAQSKAYGTARAAGKGDELKAAPVTVNLDTHREIIEKIADFDASKYGIPGMLAKRAANHVDAMTRELDAAFFDAAAAAGTAYTSTKTKKIQILEDLVAAIEGTKNDYVDGVDREDIAVIVSVGWASEIRNELDDLTNGEPYANGLIGRLHGFDVYTSNRLPSGVNAIGMRYDSVAQPCMVSQYTTEKINLGNAHAAELFYDYGTKAVTGDLIKYIGTYTAPTAEPAAANESGE